MKDWVKEGILGIILLLVGLVLTYKFFGEVIKVILGILGPILLVGGLLLLWISYEDKKLEKELEKLEKELKEEEKKEEKK